MSEKPTESVDWLSNPPMRYPTAYSWFVLVSAMDIMLTWVILHFGGTEVNPIAARVIDYWGLAGAIGFKFALMLFVIIVCEIVGRSRDPLGRRLALLSVVISSMPVIWSLTLLIRHSLRTLRRETDHDIFAEPAGSDAAAAAASSVFWSSISVSVVASAGFSTASRGRSSAVRPYR